MNQRFLGRTGLSVSELCLGAMTFGRETSEEGSRRLLDRFVAAGGNFIDTANVYGRGESERILGGWLGEQRREDLVIASKVRWPMGDGPNDQGLGRGHVLRQIEDSLRRLKTDYLDLYQVHGWDPATPLEETLATLNTLVARGLVRYIGVSNFSGWQLQRSLDLSRALGLEPFVSLQPQYNLLCRSTEWELLEVCRVEGLGVLPWSPLKGGWLTGKYTRGMSAPPPGTRVDAAEREGWSESWTNLNNEHTWRVIDALLAVAGRLERTPAQVALRWLLQKPVVTSPIIGARTAEQLEGHLGALGWELPEDAMRELDEASDLPLPYPYDFVRNGILSRERRG
ncbi:oxidoreductase (plasmid) [Deinococcus aetherius]|uniref:Oxidoreductase n=1 Tax=Deinococcus aetherius TaxID=200252 RepID=A0ABM8AK77_9DEIO|nr:aldo/keto reductase [Deinococcus aetherius]BDP44225.1 oxidoreductase [Deinococcus aetherius]